MSQFFSLQNNFFSRLVVYCCFDLKEVNSALYSQRCFSHEFFFAQTIGFPFQFHTLFNFLLENKFNNSEIVSSHRANTEKCVCNCTVPTSSIDNCTTRFFCVPKASAFIVNISLQLSKKPGGKVICLSQCARYYFSVSS